MCMAIELLTANKTCKFKMLHVLHDSNRYRRYNENGEAVFMTAALGVIMNTDTCAQRFYGGQKIRMTSKFEGDDLDFHRDDIISIDISTNRKIAVTGETG